MEQESIYKNIGIIGAGAAGAFAAVLLSKNPYNNITIFDSKEPFSSLLPTGGGRCNITNSIEDIKEFAKNYPRGEKFLLSAFSKLDSKKTRQLFKDLGVKTYVQPDNRVFPVTDSSLKTIKILSEHLNASNVHFVKNKVISVCKNDNGFELTTEKGLYSFDYLLIATGGKGNGFELAKSMGHTIIEPKPSLCALDIKEKFLYKLSGLCFKDIELSINSGKKKVSCIGDFLFTHKSISGPCVFKISALSAYQDFNQQNPLVITAKLTSFSIDEIENELKNNSKKTIKNVFSKFAPESFISEILNFNKIDGSKQAAQLKKTEKEILIQSLINLKLNAVARIKDSEIVTAGGVDLNEINSKTMESKLVSNLFFAGEILNIDGFTGGFNLQNCWSTAYIFSQNFN